VSTQSLNLQRPLLGADLYPYTKIGDLVSKVKFQHSCLGAQILPMGWGFGPALFNLGHCAFKQPKLFGDPQLSVYPSQPLLSAIGLPSNPSMIPSGLAALAARCTCTGSFKLYKAPFKAHELAEGLTAYSLIHCSHLQGMVSTSHSPPANFYSYLS